ncbi:hypothetical protein QOT17_006034 [Balamuthia mandrillaris]
MKRKDTTTVNHNNNSSSSKEKAPAHSKKRSKTEPKGKETIEVTSASTSSSAAAAAAAATAAAISFSSSSSSSSGRSVTPHPIRLQQAMDAKKPVPLSLIVIAVNGKSTSLPESQPPPKHPLTVAALEADTHAMVQLVAWGALRQLLTPLELGTVFQLMNYDWKSGELHAAQSARWPRYPHHCWISVKRATLLRVQEKREWLPRVPLGLVQYLPLFCAVSIEARLSLDDKLEALPAVRWVTTPTDAEVPVATIQVWDHDDDAAAAAAGVVAAGAEDEDEASHPSLLQLQQKNQIELVFWGDFALQLERELLALPVLPSQVLLRLRNCRTKDLCSLVLSSRYAQETPQELQICFDDHH